MDKINISTALASINKILPQKLNIEKFITSTSESVKEFQFEVVVHISNSSHSELICGAPHYVSKLVDNEKQINIESIKYINENLSKIVADQLNKYQNHKTSIYLTQETKIVESSFYCKHSCASCSSTGKVTCKTCDGSGYYSCTRCHGSGRVYLNNQQTKQPKAHPCNYCNNGRAQCTTCNSSGSVVCSSCDGETFNSIVKNVYFNANVSYLTKFQNNDTTSLLAKTINKTPIDKLITICKFEQIDSISTDESSFTIQYKASIPVVVIELLINNKSNTLTIFSNSGDFCESIALLDYVLLDIINNCNNYLSDNLHKQTKQLYKNLNSIPFINKSLKTISANAAYDEILDILISNSNDHMSKSNLAIIAKAIHRSFKYKIKQFYPFISTLILLPNLFIGVLLAFGLFTNTGKFITDTCMSELNLIVITLIASIITNYLLVKIASSSLHQTILNKSTGSFKNILKKCINYALLFAIIGGSTSSYQYDFITNYFNLPNKYIKQEAEVKKPEKSQTKQQSKKQKKKNKQ